MGFALHDGGEGGELIRYEGEGLLATFAVTGTGKNSGPVISNALKHPGQLIVLDMKGEVYAATAEARRAMGQEILYCFKCQERVTGAELEASKGLRYRVRTACKKCVPDLLATLTEREKNELAARAHAPVTQDPRT